jgi:SEC-C motif-containing protein
MICPCCPGKSYSECCKPYHDGTPAPTPLALMRSRYTAYALGKAEYIIKTTHPKSPYFETDRNQWKKGILEFCHTTKFLKLEILSSDDSSVHFIAHLSQKGPLTLEENCHFEKVNNTWLYVQKK